MASMFTAKDLEVYKDTLKGKKNRTTKPGDKPRAKTPPSVAKASKPPLKVNIEEPLKERKPLSVVHKASNTIKDPHKPPSPITPVGSSKQADQWRKAKETALKSPPPAKIRTTDANPFGKASEYKTDSLKSPRETLPLKSPHIKSDDNKAMGVRKPASPVYQKSPPVSGAKATSTVDLNASLCSECTRSASEGAVCFIGNDGRVSACTTRTAIRLCKNLNCAANNPEYVAAMANAPKKYLISKRHLLKAQFGPKSKTSRPKSPGVHQRDAAENDASQDVVSSLVEELSPHNVDGSANFESEDGDLSLFGGDLGPFDEELSLFDGSLGVDKDDEGLKSGVETTMQDVVVDEHTNFSFHDGEAAEPESPKFLIVESPKNLNETHSAGGIDNFHEDAESLAIDSFEEPEDEDLDGSPIHGDSKPEELSINYGDLMSSEEADVDDSSGNAIEPVVKSQMRDGDLIASIAEEVNNTLSTMGCEDAEQGNQTGDASPATSFNQDAESIPPLTTSIKQVVVDYTCVDQDLPKLASEQLVYGDNGGCLVSSDSGHIVDDEKSGNSTTLHIVHDDQKESDTDYGLEHDASLSVADDQHDNYPPLLVVDNGLNGDTTSLNDKHVDVHEGSMTPSHVAEDKQSNDDIAPLHDSGHVDDEDQSDEDDSSEDDEIDANIKETFATEENMRIDAQEGKEDTLNEMVVKDQDGNVSNSSTRRQRRRRALRVVEEVSPETVILRKQQMLERKQAEKWMLNHAIEGVVHKLAPTGEAKVKILVEAFESIISHTDVETIDTHNARQEKRTAA